MWRLAFVTVGALLGVEILCCDAKHVVALNADAVQYRTCLRLGAVAVSVGCVR